ncbi:MAG: hypothetical protein AAGB30_11100 [Pedobacter sp.]
METLETIDLSTTGDGRERVSVADYKRVRNKIWWKLKQFYSEVSIVDVDFMTGDILYYCTIENNVIIKKFHAIDWIKADLAGRFKEKYFDFMKSGKKTSVSVSELLGKGTKKNNFKRKNRL